jgi:hypothetical protein
MQGTGALPYFERLPEFLSVWRDFVQAVDTSSCGAETSDPPRGSTGQAATFHE